MGHKTRLHFPQPEKKLAPPPLPSFPSFHLPCQSTRPLWEVCIVRRSVWESEDVSFLQTGGEITSAHRKQTHRLLVADVMSRSECFSVILVVSAL